VLPDWHSLVVLKRSPSAVRLAIALDEVLGAQKRLEKAPAAGLPAAEQPSAGPRFETATPATAPIAKTVPAAGAHPAGKASPPAKGSPAAGSAAPEDERLARELEALIRKPGKGALKSTEVDTFWEQLSVQKEGSQQGDPGMLSFDQARQMGLAPRESD
jgi:hypothetical protein